MDDFKNALLKGIEEFETGDLINSIDSLSAAIALNPESAEAYYYRGMAYSSFEYTELALADFTKAIDINSNYAEAYYERGSAKFDIQDTKGAVEDLRMARKLNPALSDLISDMFGTID